MPSSEPINGICFCDNMVHKARIVLAEKLGKHEVNCLHIATPISNCQVVNLVLAEQQC